MTRTTPYLLAVSLVFALVSNSSAQDETAQGLLLEQHTSAIEKLELTRAAKISALNPKYEAALERIKKKHQSDGDFDATIAVGHELKSYAQPAAPDDPPAPGKASPQLVKARETYRRSVAKLQLDNDRLVVAETQDTLKKLKELATKLAATDKIDDAIETDAARKKMEAEEKYKAALARVTAAGQGDSSGSSKGRIAGLPRQGLIAHYPFDGSLANSIQGGAPIKFTGRRSFGQGHVSRALSIKNGHGEKDSYLDFPIPTTGSSFSVSFLLKASMGPHSQRTVLGIGPMDKADIMRFDYQRQGGDTGAITIYVPDWSGNQGGAERPPEEWVHMLLIVEPDIANFYLNGKKMADLRKKPVDMKGMTAHLPMYVESSRNENGGRELVHRAGITGLVDDLAIYNRALRSNEIRTITDLYRLGK